MIAKYGTAITHFVNGIIAMILAAGMIDLEMAGGLAAAWNIIMSAITGSAKAATVRIVVALMLLAPVAANAAADKEDYRRPTLMRLDTSKVKALTEVERQAEHIIEFIERKDDGVTASADPPALDFDACEEIPDEAININGTSITIGATGGIPTILASPGGAALSCAANCLSQNCKSTIDGKLQRVRFYGVDGEDWSATCFLWGGYDHPIMLSPQRYGYDYKTILEGFAQLYRVPTHCVIKGNVRVAVE